MIQTLGDPEVMEAAMSHLSRADPAIRRLVRSQGRIDFEPKGMVFRLLVRSILLQQLNGNAARLIISRVNRLFLPGRITPEKLASVPPANLRRAGVSPQKVTYLKDLASRVLDGRLALRSLARKHDEYVIEALDEVRGVGRWTAQMVLIFSLGRPDVLPVDDYGIKIAIKNVYGLGQLPKQKQIEEVAKPWHPYSTVACLYLWRHKDSK